MGFLGLFGKKKKEKGPAPVKTEDVKIQDILKWFEKNFSKNLDTFRSESRKRHSEIGKAFRDMQKAADELSKASLERTDKASSTASTLRDNFVKKVKTARLPEFPKEAGFNALSDLYARTSSLMDELLSMSPKQAFFLSKFFTKEAERVTSGIKKAKEELSGLKTLLEEEGKIMHLRDRIIRFETKRKEMESLIGERDKEKGEIAKETESLQKEVKGISSSLQSLLQSGDWKTFVETKERLKGVVLRLQKTDDLLRSELESVKRPLKKFAHVKNVPYLAPYGAVIEGKKDALMNTLKEIQKNKALKLKPKEVAKVDILIDELKKGIPNLLKKHKELQKAKRDLDRDIEKSSIKVKRGEIEGKLAEKRHELEKSRNSLLDIENTKKRIRMEIQEMKERLERAVSENTEKRIRIVEEEKKK